MVYVLADMAGSLESPVYAILGMNEKLSKIELPKGYKINELYMDSPSDENDFTVNPYIIRPLIASDNSRLICKRLLNSTNYLNSSISNIARKLIFVT